MHLKNSATAAGAWLTLQKFYVSKSPGRKVNLFKKLVRFRFDGGQALIEQINRFCEIIGSLDEIGMLIPVVIQSILFLCSFPDEFDNFVVAIEAQETLPKLEVLKVKIMEEEERRLTCVFSKFITTFIAEQFIFIIC